MNTIREIQNLNKREIENGVSIEGSWHNDYRDTAYIYIGGLPFTLTEGDIITIFSQYGEPTYLNLIRDKESGKSRGFAFLKYEDQRSTDLAVDNLGGATVMGRVLKVDHTRYERKEDEEEEGERERAMKDVDRGDQSDDSEEGENEKVPRRPLLKEEVELQKLIAEHDEDDPMKEYLIKEKKEEVIQALAVADRGAKKHRHKEHRHHHHHHYRHRSGRSRSPKRRREEEEGGQHRHHHRHRRRSRSR